MDKDTSVFNDERYVHIPVWALRGLELTSVECYVYSIILSFNQKEDDGECYCSLDYFVEMTGKDKSGVCKALKKLAKKNLITNRGKTEKGCIRYVINHKLINDLKNSNNSQLGNVITSKSEVKKCSKKVKSDNKNTTALENFQLEEFQQGVGILPTPALEKIQPPLEKIQSSVGKFPTNNKEIIKNNKFVYNQSDNKENENRSLEDEYAVQYEDGVPTTFFFECDYEY